MRKFSVRAPLTLKGRTFKGLRGWSGKPLYPQITDFSIAVHFLAVNAFPETILAAFEDHGVLARLIDDDLEGAALVLDRLARIGVDMGGVGRTLEDRRVDSFHPSFAQLLEILGAKAHHLSSR